MRIKKQKLEKTVNAINQTKKELKWAEFMKKKMITFKDALKDQPDPIKFVEQKNEA
jgi:hypothetical protein